MLPFFDLTRFQERITAIAQRLSWIVCYRGGAFLAVDSGRAGDRLHSGEGTVICNWVLVVLRPKDFKIA